MLLMIDNYDSFTFNLVHYFRSLGQEVAVHRNNEISLAEIEALAPSYIVISPGPGTPDDAGISLAVVEHFAGKIPLLGVCLGHQCIAQHFGAKVIKAKKVMHGKTSLVSHNGSGLFNQLKQPLEVTRYHSLVVEPSSVPDTLEVSAWTSDGSANSLEENTIEENSSEIMALSHKNYAIASVQFHPESILTEQGMQLLNNFLDLYRQDQGTE